MKIALVGQTTRIALIDRGITALPPITGGIIGDDYNLKQKLKLSLKKNIYLKLKLK